MAEPFIGQLLLFAGNFAPRGWAFCQGQALSIAQNTTLFSLIGTTYGGDGVSTFNLPDLRGRVAVGQGQGPGLAGYVMGQEAGVETVTLTTQQMPAHTHAVSATLTVDASPGSTTAATGANIAEIVQTPGRPPTLYNAFTTGTPASPATVAGLAVTVQSIGNSGSHTNLQPYLTLNYIIALQGIYPARN
ncbi:MAG: phage tail protein [Janthinobacterium lividum]